MKRVLGHSDGSVTAIYNRYAYVREMRKALERWADELTKSTPDENPIASSETRFAADTPTPIRADRMRIS